MSNPLATATQGKGFFSMLARGRAIASRYSLTPAKIDSALEQLVNTLKQFACQATIPITATVLSRHSSVAQKYQVQGLELAVHGLVHMDYTRTRF